MDYHAAVEPSGKIAITIGAPYQPVQSGVRDPNAYVCKMNQDQAEALAVDLLTAVRGPVLGYTFACPKCANGLLSIQYFAGSPGVMYYPDGSGEPPEAPYIEGIDSTCDCWPEDEVTRILEGVPVLSWFCLALMDRDKGGRPHRVSITDPVVAYRCFSYSPVGKPCERCGASEPEGAERRMLTEAHPAYKLLDDLIVAHQAITWHYTDQAMAQFFVEEDAEIAAEEAWGTIDER